MNFLTFLFITVAIVLLLSAFVLFKKKLKEIPGTDPRSFADRDWYFARVRVKHFNGLPQIDTIIFPDRKHTGINSVNYAIHCIEDWMPGTKVEEILSLTRLS